MSQMLTFRQALAQVELLARSKLPKEVHERLSCAVALVTNGKVWLEDDGVHAAVQSRTDPAVWYAVNAACACADATYQAPEGLCAHRLAAMLQRRALQLMANPIILELDDAPVDPGIDARFVVSLHGKQFVQYAGLLALAHARGLVSLKARLISVTESLALAEAEAMFADGRVFIESADATPQNVAAQVRPHFARMALTRAKARALRDALNISVCTIEELGE